jgi:hypothetical protein
MSDILKKICDVKVQEVAAAKKATTGDAPTITLSAINQVIELDDVNLRQLANTII